MTKPTTGKLFWIKHDFLEGAAAKFWEQAARCLQEAQGDFGIARDYYYKAVAQQLQMSDPALHAEMQSGAHAGPGQEARVALTFFFLANGTMTGRCARPVGKAGKGPPRPLHQHCLQTLRQRCSLLHRHGPRRSSLPRCLAGRTASLDSQG